MMSRHWECWGQNREVEWILGDSRVARTGESGGEGGGWAVVGSGGGRGVDGRGCF